MLGKIRELNGLEGMGWIDQSPKIIFKNFPYIKSESNKQKHMW